MRKFGEGKNTVSEVGEKLLIFPNFSKNFSTFSDPQRINFGLEFTPVSSPRNARIVLGKTPLPAQKVSAFLDSEFFNFGSFIRTIIFFRSGLYPYRSQKDLCGAPLLVLRLRYKPTKSCSHLFSRPRHSASLPPDVAPPEATFLLGRILPVWVASSNVCDEMLCLSRL